MSPQFSKHAHARLQSRHVDPVLVAKTLADGLIVESTPQKIIFKRNRLFVVMSTDMTTVITVYKQRKSAAKRHRRERIREKKKIHKRMGMGGC